MRADVQGRNEAQLRRLPPTAKRSWTQQMLSAEPLPDNFKKEALRLNPLPVQNFLLHLTPLRHVRPACVRTASSRTITLGCKTTSSIRQAFLDAALNFWHGLSIPVCPKQAQKSRLAKRPEWIWATRSKPVSGSWLSVLLSLAPTTTVMLSTREALVRQRARRQESALC